MRTTGLPLLLLGLAATLPALAEDPALTAASSPALAASSSVTGATVEVDLREEYLAGDKILVRVTLRNTGTAPLTVPDLSARPWLVTFRLVTPGSQRQERRTKPPELDPGKTVVIAPRSSRQTLLEVPSGAALKAGSYQLGLAVDLGSETLELPERPVSLVAPKAVAGQLSAEASVTESSRLSALWVHQAGTGFQLYLQEAAPSDPNVVLADWFLTSLPSASKVQVSASRPSQAWDRHVIWAEGERRLSYARLGAQSLRTDIASVEAPWPKVELAGRAATAGSGDLHVPVWVPSPKGSRGEFRILSIGERGTPNFQRAGLLETAPLDVQTAVSDDGTAQFLVLSTSSLDLYSLNEAPKPEADSIPVPARRIFRVEAGHTITSARFAVLPETETYAGGLAILVVTQTAEGLQPTWISTRGAVIKQLPIIAGLKDTVLALHPRGFEAPGLLLQSADGNARFVRGATNRAVGKLQDPWALASDNKGRALLRQLGSPVKTTLLEP